MKTMIISSNCSGGGKTTVTLGLMKALKNRVVKLENLLEEAEKDLEALRELRFEPEYYQDFQKMDQLNECIDLKHNEINSLMKEWEEKMQILEEH